MTDTATAPGAAGAAAPAAAAAPAGGAAGAAAFDWAQAGLDTDTLTYVQAKGFKDIPSVVSSYRNFEKLQGVPQDRLLKLPGADAKPEEWAPVFDKLGRPADPSKYELAKFDIGLDEKATEQFVGFLRNTFHGLGISNKQAAGFTQKWSEFVTAQVREQNAAAEQKAVAEEGELKNEWGAQFDKNVNMAGQGVQALGLDTETLDAIENAIGYGRTMKLMHAIGSKMGEAGYAGGDIPAGGGGKAAAIAEIASLRNDIEFGKKIAAGDAEAKAKWDRLHLAAYGS